MRFVRRSHASASYAVDAADREELARLRESFARHHVAHVPALLDSHLLDAFRAAIARAAFVDSQDEHIARESQMVAPEVITRLMFLMNDERFIACVRAATGIDELAGFHGRVFRFGRDEDHYDSWHTDVDGSRRVALSLNLSDGRISGGELSLRRVGSGDATEHPYPPPGDGLLFRIDDALEHRVNPVRSELPRTTMAGWFVTDATLQDLLHPD